MICGTIGSFQALKHRFADMYLAVEKANAIMPAPTTHPNLSAALAEMRADEWS